MFTYRVDKSYDWNYEHGPSFTEPHPDVPFLAVRAARTVLSSGVTTVRDVGDESGRQLGHRRRG